MGLCYDGSRLGCLPAGVVVLLILALSGCSATPHSVSISSDPPGAIVFLNNRMIGETPMETVIAQRKGSYNMYRFKAIKDGFKVARKNYREKYYDSTVNDTVPESIHFVLAKRRRIPLEVTSSPPGAVVTLNGDVIGETPCEAVIYERIGPPRKFRFTVTKDGFAPLQKVVEESKDLPKGKQKGDELPDGLHFDLVGGIVSSMERGS